jgi:hypothetical protein
MAAGDLIVRDHQYEYNSILMGSQTGYITESWAGLFDSAPGLRSDDFERQDVDGVIPGFDLLGGRTIETVINILNETGSQASMYAQVLALQGALARRQTEIPLVYKLPGQTKRQVFCRPRKVQAAKTADMTLGLAQSAVQFFASDPLHYELVPVVASLIHPGGSTAQVSMDVVVGGNHPVAGVFTVSGGDIYEPKIAVSGQTAIDGTSDNGLFTRYNSTLLNSQGTMTVDMKNKRVGIGSGYNAYNSTDSNWWRFYPGHNTVIFSRNLQLDTADPVTLNMSVYPAWLY